MTHERESLRSRGEREGQTLTGNEASLIFLASLILLQPLSRSDTRKERIGSMGGTGSRLVRRCFVGVGARAQEGRRGGGVDWIGKRRRRGRHRKGEGGAVAVAGQEGHRKGAFTDGAPSLPFLWLLHICHHESNEATKLSLLSTCHATSSC